MLFQLVLTKFFKSELFSCLPKFDQVTTVMQRAYSTPTVLTRLNMSHFLMQPPHKLANHSHQLTSLKNAECDHVQFT